MTKDDNEVRRIIAYITGQEHVVKARVLGMFKSMTSNDVVQQFKDLFAAHKFQPILTIADGFVEDASGVIGEVFTNAGDREMRVLTRKFEVQRVRKAIEIDPSVSLGFDVGNAAAAQALREATLEFIKEITDSLRETIRKVLTYAQLNGLGAVEASRMFKDSLTLTSFQNDIVNNYRKLLETGNLDALSRSLRDRRFDSTIESTFRSGRLLDTSQIDRMVDRYRSRMVDMRAETIARTEAGAVVEAARYEALGQMSQQLGVKQSEIIRTWRTVIDNRTRDSHHKMNGQQRKGKKPFTLPSGRSIRYPRDRKAPAGEIINCRCTVLTSLRELTNVQQQLPENAIAAQPPVIIETGGALEADAFVENWAGGYYVPKSPIPTPKLSGLSVGDFPRFVARWEVHAHRLFKEGLTKALTTAEKSALRSYTSAAYMPINKVLKYLRGTLGPGESLGSIYADELNFINRAMSKASLNESITVYRGVGSRVRFEQLINNLKVGETVLLDKGFISTSLKPDIAMQFTTSTKRLKILVPKGAKALCLEQITEAPFEFEVLLNRGSVFVVREVTKDEIVLELVLS
jgi:hypothetical protein